MDVSRLVWRSHRAAPGGIDRVELALAEALLSTTHEVQFVFSDVGRLRGLRAGAVRRLVHDTAVRWRGSIGDGGHRQVQAYLAGENVFPPMTQAWRDGQLTFAELAEWLRGFVRYAHFEAVDLQSTARAAATYVNVSHRNLGRTSLMQQLEGFGRKVAYLHDDIPLRHPDMALPKLNRDFAAMFRNVALSGFEVLTNSRTSAERLLESAARLGVRLADPTVIPPPLPTHLLAPIPRRVTARRFFLTSGLFTFRKNLRVLHEAAATLELTEMAPFDIVFVGTPGRDAAQLLAGFGAGLQRVRMLRAEGLSDLAYRELLAASCGLLAPSLDEGFDYPAHEALAAGIPVLASDIAVHRELLTGQAVLLPTHDAKRWGGALQQALEQPQAGVAGRSLPSQASAAAMLGYVIGG